MSDLIQKINSNSVKKINSTPKITKPKEIETNSIFLESKADFLPKIDFDKPDEPDSFIDFNTLQQSLKSSRNGEIEATKQGKIGDCWLLSAVNALSYSEKGREIIKNALEYGDLSTTVHLAFGDYEITNSEFNNAIMSGKYSTGDDDMVFLELATEKMLQDIIDNKLVVLNETNSTALEGLAQMAKYLNYNPDSILNGGSLEEGIFLLTGKLGESEADNSGSLDKCLTDKEKSWLDEFQQNGNQDMILTADLSNLAESYAEAKDVNGNDIKIYTQHAYAIKEVTDDTVTVINPWDSNEEIKISRDTFYNTFTGVSKTDLSDTNPKKNLIVPRSEIVPDDLEVTKRELYELAGLNKEDREFAVDIMKKYPDLNKDDIVSYSKSENNDFVTMQYLDEYANGTGGKHINRLLSKKLKGGFLQFDTLKKCLKKLDKLNDGNKNTYYQRIISRHLLLNPYIQRELGGDDIYYLSQISDNNWEKAMEYLKTDSNLSGKDIYNMFR